MRRDISELRLRLRWLRRRKPWRGRCWIKVYENGFPRPKRARRGLSSKVCLFYKISNFKYIYIYLTRFIFDKFEQHKLRDSGCVARRNIDGRLGGLARVVKVACGTRGSSVVDRIDPRNARPGEKNWKEKKTRMRTWEKKRRGTERRSMRSTMSRVIRTFPRDDLARVCGVAVLTSKNKENTILV